MNEIRPPHPRPCPSCPYRRDVPSGLWHEEEYAKLPAYDEPTFAQPPNLFLCHQMDDGALCAGWCGTHDMDENLALRFAAMDQSLSLADIEAIRDYETDVQLFDSGSEAAAHGRRGIETPDAAARQAIDKLLAKQERRNGADRRAG